MSDIAEYRLYNQHIAQPRHPDVAAALTWMGAVQGQDYPGAKWSLGLRTPGSTDADVEQAISDKKIVRTWVMRGTLFLVPAADVRWMTELCRPRVMAQMAPRFAELELDEATIQHSSAVLVNALAGGLQLTRKALFEVLESHGISTAGQRGIHLLHRASLDGLLCQGTVENNNPSFMRIDEALSGARTLPRDEALALLAQRYFTSRGPATLQDFAWWLGLPMADARAGLEAVKSQLVETVIDGVSYWMPPPTMTPQPDPAYAPPGFDEYLLGYKVRDAVLDSQHANKVCPGKNGVFFPTMVLGGRMVGVWKRTVKRGALVIDPQPFVPLSDEDMAAFSAAAQRFGEFWGMPVVVTHPPQH